MILNSFGKIHVDLPQILIDVVDELVHPNAIDRKLYDPSVPINLQIPRRDNTFLQMKGKILQDDLNTF